MAVRTGLSKTVCGHLIELTRDERAKVAQVVVKPPADGTPTATEQAAVKSAADLLARQARRFFGLGWKVQDWNRE